MAVPNSAAEGGTNDWGPAMPGTACERNGHTARRPGFPFGSAFDFSALRTEHLCAPSFRQHAGTSLCTRPTASTGRRGPAPKNKTSKAATMRRKVYSGYSNVLTRATARRYLTESQVRTAFGDHRYLASHSCRNAAPSEPRAERGSNRPQRR